MRIKLFPHSWLEIEAAGRRIHVDPSFAYGYFPDGDQTGEHPPEAVEPADLILITHGDHDHLDPRTVERLRSESTRVFCPADCLPELGPSASPVAEGDELDLDWIRVEVVPAHNTPEGRSTSKHHVRGESVGYVLEVEGRRIYHAGDTDLIPEMTGLGDLDAAFLPIGGTFTMDIEEAVEAALAIEPVLAVPIHTRGQADPREFVRRLGERGASFGAVAPSPGEPIEIPERKMAPGEKGRDRG